MKQILLCIAITMVLSGCKKDGTTAKGMDLAKQACGNSDMLWLSDIIAKGEEDKATGKYLGNYLGTIYLTTYRSNNVFMITMALGSGGLKFYAYNCDHQNVPLTNNDAGTFYTETLKSGKVIYTNVP